MTVPTTCTKCGAPISPAMQTCRECGWSTSMVFDHGQVPAPAQPAVRLSFGNKAPPPVERPLKLSFNLPEAVTPNPTPAPRPEPSKRVKPPKLPKPPRAPKESRRRRVKREEVGGDATANVLAVIVTMMFVVFIIAAMST